MSKPRQRAHTSTADDHVSETDEDDTHDFSEDENDENKPINVEDTFSHILLTLRTPLSHSRVSRDTALRDITDQFFHPPSPSPIRVSKLKRSAPHTIEPPRRPKKPKSLAYPADPPNWLCSRSSSSLPPSSPFPPSTANVDYAHPHLTDHSVRHSTPARHAYYLGTPSKASDSDPFGFVAVERALKARRAPTHKPTSRISAVKSPPRSTVLSSVPSHTHAPVFTSHSHLDAPIPTNNEDIEGLYTDEPVAGPSRGHVLVAPLLMMNSDSPSGEIDATRSQPAFADPLRTPRKRRHRVPATLDGGSDTDEQGLDVLSTPSPVKLSTAGSHTHNHHRLDTARSHTPILRLTRAQTRAAGTGKPRTTQASRTSIQTSYQHIPTPSSTCLSASSRQSTAPPTPVPPRRSTRQAAVGARAKLGGTTGASEGGNENEGEGGRMTLRSRSVKVNKETKTAKPTGRAKHPPSTSKASPRKAQRVTTAKQARGRPKGELSVKSTKGKRKARRLENVLDLSDESREKYDKERRERLEYFKRLEGYQIQKENVYVV